MLLPWKTIFQQRFSQTIIIWHSHLQSSVYYAPATVEKAGALGVHRRPSSVCLMSRTSALTRKPKGLGRRNFAQGYPRSHETPTPTSRSKGPKSRWGGGILWRRPSRTACSLWPSPVWYDCHGNACMHSIYYGHQAHETNINQRANRAGDSLIHTHCSGGII